MPPPHDSQAPTECGLQPVLPHLLTLACLSCTRHHHLICALPCLPRSSPCLSSPARNLAAKDWAGTSDPYVKLQYDGRTYRTSTVFSTRHRCGTVPLYCQRTPAFCPGGQLVAVLVFWQCRRDIESEGPLRPSFLAVQMI
jgi:hypothetical protein